MAQALGDFASLDVAGRRALHAHLPAPDGALVRRLADALVGRMANERGEAGASGPPTRG
jgi:hypothetical protein